MSCPIGTDIQHAVALLRDGGLVAFATETVYGLGANALDTKAVARVFEAKKRPRFDPLIVHVANRDQLAGLVTEMPEAAQRLAEQFWPGPLTLVLPKTDHVPDLVTSGLPTVAVRIPDHAMALELLRAVAVPIAAPSANPFGCVSPTTAQHVAEQLGDSIDYILDGGSCRVGIESTVLQVGDGEAMLLRPGGLPVESIEKVIGPVALLESSVDDEEAAQIAPGRLMKHYAPRTSLTVITDWSQLSDIVEKRVGILAFQAIPESVSCVAREILSAQGDLAEAAANFFAALRRLDSRNLDLILVESFPETGLGRALNDRLSRAACE